MGAFDDLIPGGKLSINEGPNGGVGSKEAATRETMYGSDPALHSMGRDLGTATLLNNRIPTGHSKRSSPGNSLLAGFLRTLLTIRSSAA